MGSGLDESIYWFQQSELQLVPCGRKRFCRRCLGIEVALYAIRFFFSRIRCCRNMITEPLSSNGRLALLSLLRRLGVILQYNFLALITIFDTHYEERSENFIR
jgi:hypothetical protein